LQEVKAMSRTSTRERSYLEAGSVALLLFLGIFVATRPARSQEPPPYPGPDAASAEAEPQGDDGGAAADPTVASVEYFHQQLAPYGQWVQREGYGAVWVPRTAPGWRPYTSGHWAYTDQGWAWVADESWGWAPFHYGRWFYDAEIGWGWVPGTVWAPAWVAWRHGGGYLGWAPLPPAVGFTLAAGLVFGGVEITPGFYTFVSERNILAPRVGVVIVRSTENVTIVRNTTNITNYTMVNNRIVDRGVAVERIEQVTGRPVRQVTVASMMSTTGGRRGAFYQPAVVVRAARVARAEFGKALPNQVAVQQRSRSLARLTASDRTAGNAGNASGPRRRTLSTGDSTSTTPRSTAGQEGHHRRTPLANGDSDVTGHPGHSTGGVTSTSGESHATGASGASGSPSHTAQGSVTESKGESKGTPKEKEREKEKERRPPQ
jgi:hypothetical protein